MLKTLLSLLLIILLGSCFKESIGPATPPEPLAPLPEIVITNYEAFPSTDTLFTTGIKGNTIGFGFRDYWGSFTRPWDLPDWILNNKLMKIANEAYQKVFPDSMKIDNSILNGYDILLEIRWEDGRWQFSRNWSVYKVRQY